MKIGNVLLCCAPLALLVVPCRATAQDVTRDDFLGALNPDIPWIWTVTGNDPTDTEDATHYAFSDNSLDIMAQAGSLYGSNNNAHNILNLVITSQPDNWYVETAVRTDWSMASVDWYVHAGLVFFIDADNYFNYYNNRNADPMHRPAVQVSSTFEQLQQPNYGGISSGDWDPTTAYVKLRVEGTPSQVTFKFDRDGTGFQVAGTLSSGPSFDFMSSMVGKQVGLETDTGGGHNDSPFSFNYFETNLGVQ